MPLTMRLGRPHDLPTEGLPVTPRPVVCGGPEETEVNLLVTISGEFDLTDEELSNLSEDLEEECRAYWGGTGVTVEVEKR